MFGGRGGGGGLSLLWRQPEAAAEAAATAPAPTKAAESRAEHAARIYLQASAGAEKRKRDVPVNRLAARRDAMFGVSGNARATLRANLCAPFIERACEKQRALVARKLQGMHVMQRWRYRALDATTARNMADVEADEDECEGDLCVRRIQEALAYMERHGFRRSKHQRIFHHIFTIASLQPLYGADLTQNLQRLLKKYDIKQMRSDVAATTPRRWGKTWSVAMWTAALTVTQRSHDTSIYSTASRVSKMMLDLIRRLIALMQRKAKFSGKVTRIANNEELLYVTHENFENSVHAYPSSVETLRGTGAKCKTGCIVAEEAGFIPVRVVENVIMPTLTRAGIMSIWITTSNPNNEMLKSFTTAKFPDGSNVMLVVDCQLSCVACRREGRASKCTHMMRDLPHWSSGAQHAKLRALMRSNKEAYNREVRGIEMSDLRKPAFNSDCIDYLRGGAAHDKHAMAPPDLLVCTVDPAAGGDRSAYALVTCAYKQRINANMGDDFTVTVRTQRKRERDGARARARARTQNR